MLTFLHVNCWVHSLGVQIASYEDGHGDKVVNGIEATYKNAADKNFRSDVASIGHGLSMITINAAFYAFLSE